LWPCQQQKQEYKTKTPNDREGTLQFQAVPSHFQVISIPSHFQAISNTFQERHRRAKREKRHKLHPLEPRRENKGGARRQEEKSDLQHRGGSGAGTSRPPSSLKQQQQQCVAWLPVCVDNIQFRMQLINQSSNSYQSVQSINLSIYQSINLKLSD